ncbi:enhancer of polycomb-like domain-containing protein [Ditylenchus destructor]|nr:enhancer of polycomb-like domain-containing protein [Ditylenchus destructor]
MMPEKKHVFRPRALDPNKRLPIRIRQKSRGHVSPKVKRAVQVAPSGMEKEEEMESHLQQAIYAQKATSAGVRVENHVIPTPKVCAIDEEEYRKIYNRPSRVSQQRSKQFITFRDYVSFFLNQSVYDADSEDEEWLHSHQNISIDHFEQIIEKLELASQTDIIQPLDAKVLLQRYEPQIVDDVYDYWLQKRKQAASKLSKCSVLIPRLNTDGRHRDDKTVINPYIAFRKRADKVQTRKKQKTEIQTYEKMLRVNYAMKKSIALLEMMKQREKTKLALVDLEEAVFARQLRLADEQNKELDRITAAVAKPFKIPEQPPPKKQRPLDNGKSLSITMAQTTASLSKASKSVNNFLTVNSARRRPMKVKCEKVEPVTAASMIHDQNMININWLRRNEEVWNRITPTTVTATPESGQTSVAWPSVLYPSSIEADKVAEVEKNSSADGRYEFVPKANCKYQKPLVAANLIPKSLEDGTIEDMKYNMKLASMRPQDRPKYAYVRPRFGRGGRRLFDFHFA